MLCYSEPQILYLIFVLTRLTFMYTCQTIFCTPSWINCIVPRTSIQFDRLQQKTYMTTTAWYTGHIPLQPRPPFQLFLLWFLPRDFRLFIHVTIRTKGFTVPISNTSTKNHRPPESVQIDSFKPNSKNANNPITFSGDRIGTFYASSAIYRVSCSCHRVRFILLVAFAIDGTEEMPSIALELVEVYRYIGNETETGSTNGY